MRPPNTILRAASARSLPSDAWTVDLIRSAEVSADAGQLRWAAELCDALLGDDRVQAAREHLAGLFGLPLTFEDGAGTARTKKRARRALEAQEDWWEIFPDEALVELLFWGVLLGVGLGELVWTSRRGRWVPRLMVWHPRALRWDTVQGRWMVRLADGSEVAIEPGDGKWVVFTPRSSTRPWVHGAWRAVARWWRAKRYALSDWGRHSEQAGGLKVASTTDGTDADRRKLAADLGDAGTDAAVVMPPGWDLKQLAVPSSTVDVFDRLIDAADGAITLTLLGQNLTTEVTEGSRAAASVHATVSAVCLQALAASLSSTLRAQVLDRWAFYNFNDPAAAPWPLWDTAPPADREAEARVFETVTRTAVALAGQGAPVDWRAMAEAHGVPLLRREQDVFTAGSPVFGYHLQYGVVTVNEARARVGLPPLPDGDRMPTLPASSSTPTAPTAPAALSAASATTPAERRAIAGQVYVDAVFDAAMKRAPAALDAGILGAVQQAVREARDYESLRAELVRLVKDVDDSALQELVLGVVMNCANAGSFTAAEG